MNCPQAQSSLAALCSPSGAATQLADQAGLGLGGPGFEMLVGALAEHVRELAGQAAG